jgi:hypothetical protein
MVRKPMQVFVGNKSRLLLVGLVQGPAGFCSVQ